MQSDILGESTAWSGSSKGSPPCSEAPLQVFCVTFLSTKQDDVAHSHSLGWESHEDISPSVFPPKRGGNFPLNYGGSGCPHAGHSFDRLMVQKAKEQTADCGTKEESTPLIRSSAHSKSTV
eukprot:s2163_g12.t1